MIVTTLKAGGREFSGLSSALMTPDEIREWERDMVAETDEITAVDRSTGERYRYVRGEWVEVPQQTNEAQTAA